MRRIPLLAVLLAPAVLGGIQGCAKIEARDLIREGNAAYNDGKYVEAIEKYDQAVELEPDGVTLYWNRACAAESLVLKIKDPKRAEERRKYADMALKDFHTWFDRLEQKSDEDAKQLDDHRLAILDADERCDDLLEHWREKHRANPKEEGLYSVIARQYDKCGKKDDATKWFVKRTEDFPESVRAWHGLAIRKFDPLWPDPDSGLPYNTAMEPGERTKVADDVIATLDRATQVDPKFRDAYVWRSMAYTQRGLSRVIVEEPENAQERLEAILAREDTMLAWKQQKAVCDLDELPECPKDKVPEGPCCPPPPLSAEEQAADAEQKKEIEAEIKAAAEGGKRRKRRRR